MASFRFYTKVGNSEYPTVPATSTLYIVGDVGGVIITAVTKVGN